MLKKNLITPCKLLILLLVLGSFLTNAKGQTTTVSGTVIDPAGELLIGVNIVEKGTTNGTITDINGRFSLPVTGGSNAILVFSYIGYNQQEIKVGNQTTFKVQLREDTQNLDEVVVIGYGTARKRDLTGAISSVRAESIEAEAPRSVHDILRSNAAGLSVRMSTNARGTGDIQIRGKNTLNAGSSPLIVLDGVIFQGDMQDINPNDIQTIDILKDASSASVYGAKAASGVLAITTKKGKIGKPLVTFNANVGLVQAARLPKTLDADGYLQFRYDYEMGKTTDADKEKYPGKFVDPRKLGELGIDQLTWYNYTQNTPVTSLPDEQALITAWLTRLELKAPEIENYLNNRITNWDDIVQQTGLEQDYTVALSNRSENVSYYWSLGYTDREGIRKNEKYTNFRTRLNLESKVADFLSVGVNASFNTRDDLYMPTDDQRMIADVGQRENLSPYAANEIDDPNSPNRMYPTGDNNSKNPFYDALYRDKKNLTHYFNANLYGQLRLPFGIEYQMNFTPYYRFHEYYYHESKEHTEWASSGGRAHRRTAKEFKWQIDNIIRWKQTFAQDHKVEVTLLQNAEKGQSWQTEANNTQFSPSDILGYHRLQAGTVPTVSSTDKSYTGDALMARLFYSYQDRYMITSSVRRDGYSGFGQQHPRATFPSVALGWVFTSEKFMENVDHWLNYGKLRLSWGINGNRDFGTDRDQYFSLSDLTASAHPYINQSGTLYTTSQLWVNRMNNKSLKWEETTSFNVGLDFSLFNDILSGSMEFYKSETNDLLVLRSLPTIIGFDNVFTNLGKVSNYGYEMTLNANPVNIKDLSWNISGTFSFNRREIKELYGDMVDIRDENGNVIGQREDDDIPNKWFIGQDPDRIWEYERDGVWQTDEKDKATIYGCQPGDFKYIDQNDDGVMDNDDRVFQGYTTPRYRWSLRNSLTFYKNFELSCLIYSHIGHYGTFNRAANGLSLADRRTWFDQPRWTPENPINDYARIGSKNIGSNYVKKSFARIDNISLTYNVPKSFINRFKVQDMRLSLSARNVAVISPGWKFGDVEEGDWTPRSYSISVNFSL